MRVLVVFIGLLMLAACTEQHDPRRDWQKFDQEQHYGNRQVETLNEDGTIPAPAIEEGAGEVVAVDEQYQNFCSSCHGIEGGGDGAAGAALDPSSEKF